MSVVVLFTCCLASSAEMFLAACDMLRPIRFSYGRNKFANESCERLDVVGVSGMEVR